jgi:hypothetical protein
MPLALLGAPWGFLLGLVGLDQMDTATLDLLAGQGAVLLQTAELERV